MRLLFPLTLHDPDSAADYIDKTTLEIKQDEDKTVYTELQDIAEDLPDHSPRFVLLSYPLTLVSLAMSDHKSLYNT